ncbi:hypothetical protein FOMG_19988 [Fusarium oxysporum f. sp. melonis 26406]|uniref:Uncharacterized protein n=1 Tax=Fusarium oxysporum f. sp. melonis 26406 TaxID=1089452 RepID=W9Z3M9_FUSOX|nr:hypothetical protein FOMG_19988 [Fusarium oxysporum f. sp. melonis 26406]
MKTGRAPDVFFSLFALFAQNVIRTRNVASVY